MLYSSAALLETELITGAEKAKLDKK